MFQKTTTYLAFGLFLLFCYFTIFHHLGLQPIQSWDEGLFAMRAYFLAETGQLMPAFTVFDETFTHPNIKPPFTTYFQALSFKLLDTLSPKYTLVILSLCSLASFLMDFASCSKFSSLFNSLNSLPILLGI